MSTQRSKSPVNLRASFTTPEKLRCRSFRLCAEVHRIAVKRSGVHSASHSSHHGFIDVGKAQRTPICSKLGTFCGVSPLDLAQATRTGPAMANLLLLVARGEQSADQATPNVTSRLNVDKWIANECDKTPQYAPSRAVRPEATPRQHASRRKHERANNDHLPVGHGLY